MSSFSGLLWKAPQIFLKKPIRPSWRSPSDLLGEAHQAFLEKSLRSSKRSLSGLLWEASQVLLEKSLRYSRRSPSGFLWKCPLVLYEKAFPGLLWETLFWSSLKRPSREALVVHLSQEIWISSKKKFWASLRKP